jgi:RHS repeat-associated protein
MARYRIFKALGACLLLLWSVLPVAALAQTSSTTTLTSSVNPSYVNQATTLTATVSGASPSGNVTFKDGTTVLGTYGLSAGVAKMNWSSGTSGTHSLSATYNGDANNTGSSATVSQTVNPKNPTTTSLSSSLNPAYVSQTVTLTATVSGVGAAPTGSVTFKDGTNYLSSASLSSGRATVNVSFSTTGTHSITATYNADTSNAGSTSAALSQTVNPKNPTTTSLSSNLNPAYISQTVALTASVSGAGPTPTGSVTFKDGTNYLSSASLSSGSATVNVSFSSAGTHSLTATYNADTSNAGSTSSTLAQTINATPTTTTLSCPASTTVMVSVNCTVTVSTSSYNSALSGQTVQIVEGGTTVGSGTLAYASSPSNFTSTIALPANAAPVNTVGAHNLQAQFAGTATLAASSSAAQSFTVNQRTSTTALSSSAPTAGAGEHVTLSATVTGTSPSGSVTFLDGSTTLATVPLSGGTASLDTTFSTTGSHSLSASYAGDTNNTASTSAAVTETITATGPTTTVLSAAPNPVNAGQTVALTAAVSGSSPSGSVVFQEGSTTLGAAPVSNGQATLSTSFALAGSHSLSATYQGDTANAASSSDAFSLSVSRANTSASLSANPGPAYQRQTVTLTMALTGAAPTGSVSFSEGSTSLGTSSVSNGQATLTASFSTVGSHSISASYAGDANNTASSASTSVQVLAGPVPPSSVAPVASYEYDANGNPTKTTVAPGVSGFNFASSTAYDNLDRPKTSTDARNGLAKYAFDGQDRLLSVTDPRNLLTQYPRNGLGDVSKVQSPDTGSTNYTYDAAGNPLSRTDSRGVQAGYQWDALNRLQSITYSGGGFASGESYGWDYDQTGPGITNGIGRLTGLDYPGGSARYGYDDQGRMTYEQDQVAAQAGVSAAIGQAVSYGYDGAGHLTSITYPSGRVITYSYTNGLLNAIGLKASADAGTAASLLSDIHWQPFGAPDSWNWQMASGPQAYSRLYDGYGRIVRYPLGNLLRDLNYDAGGRIKSYTHYDSTDGQAQPNYDQSFGYDELGRLTSVGTNVNTWGIQYDANGNRTGFTLNGTSQAYSVDAASNKLLNVNQSRIFGYDNAGNTQSDSTSYTATYGISGMLASLTKAGITTSYSYNNNGQRIRKSDGTTAGTTVFVYDFNSGNLLGEYDASGNPVKEYVWMGSQLVAVMTPDPANPSNPPLVYYVYSDHLNTPRVIVDQGNNIRWRWLAEPFGNTAPETNPSNLGTFVFNLRYPGQYADQESGLFYNINRYYDPSLGRYAQSDPIGLAGGQFSTYAYVNGDPLLYYDPNGLWAWGDPLPQGLVDFSAGFGDTLSFGVTNWVRNEMGTNDAVNKCSAYYTAGEYSGIALDVAIGGAAGLEAAGTRGAGKEFSHWIPNRMGGPRSMWNGNYVTKEVHALSDPYRYRFMPKSWKAQNPMPNVAWQQWVRIPNVYKGAAAGGAAGAAGAALSNDCTCPQ